jgi:hypothetical protein
MWNKLKSWIAHKDETLASVNVFALILATDQLLYAPSLELAFGNPGHFAWPVALTAPAFALTPWIARRHSLAARIWLPFIGIVNTMVAQLALGYASGVWVFLLPSVTLATLVLERRERLALVLLTSLALAVLLFLPAGRTVLSADTAGAMARLNAGSAIILTGFIGWIFGAKKLQPETV